MTTETVTRAVVYTDGACHGNHGPGGWVVVLRVEGEDERPRTGGEPRYRRRTERGSRHANEGASR